MSTQHAISQNPDDSTSLAGFRVLVVEDDYFVAKEVTMILRDHGAQVLGPVPDAARGRKLASESAPDCALLDVNLKGQFVFDLATELIERGVPSIFTTGYDSSFLPQRLRHAPCLQKPIDPQSLVQTIRLEAGARCAPGRPSRSP
jgi:DNA-binding response OmpR family regulator